MSSLPQKIMQSHIEQLTSSFEAAKNIAHTGENGRAKETLLIDFFRKIVPSGFGVGNGFIIDTRGRQSRQQDIIIYHSSYHPRFEIGGVIFFPVEAVAAVIEVKTKLDSRELRAALENSKSVKILDRTSDGENYIVPPPNAQIRTSHNVSVAIGALPVDPNHHHNQIFSLIVALESMNPDSLIKDALMPHLSTTSRVAWPNMVAVHEQWSLTYNQPQENVPRTDPMTATSLRLAKASNPKNVSPLIDAVEQLWSFLRVASVIDVFPNAYLTGSYFEDLNYPLPE